MFTQRQITGPHGPLNVMYGPRNGRPLVFLHGVGRSWQDFYTLLPALAWRWQVVGLDFRGHGLSGRTPRQYLVRHYVSDAVALITDLTAPVVVYGHSLGALAAAGAAAQLPQRVRAVILEDPPFETLGENIARTQFYGLFTIMRAASSSPLAVDALARSLAEARVTPPGSVTGVRLGDVRDATALRFMAACLKHVDPTLSDPLLAGQWLDGYDKSAVLAGIRCPTLLLQGDVSLGGMLSESAATQVQRQITHCLHQPVAGVGHLIHSLQAETTLRLVGGFLESLALGDQA
jgi:pimeloyl-ACP methyl ester carboxylesterase